jgi:hypothetical protein
MARSPSTTVLWAIIAVLILLVVLLLSSASPTAPPPPPPPIVLVAPSSVPPRSPPTPTPMSAEKIYGATTLSYRPVAVEGGPEIPGWARAKDSLNTYYPQAPASIPTDYTLESCPCPFRKPQKSDLPIPDIPICSLLQQTSYKLSEFQ